MLNIFVPQPQGLGRIDVGRSLQIPTDAVWLMIASMGVTYALFKRKGWL